MGGTDNIVNAMTIMQAAIMPAIAVAVVEGQSHQSVLPPTDIIEEYMEDVIQEFDLQIDLGKRKADDSVSLFARNKRQMVKYNRVRALKAVREDYLDTRPIFNDRQFECVFRIKRYLVDDLLGKLVNHSSFWTSTVDACGQKSIDPYVKVLAAQKMICYGVSVSAFHDYFQMGESTGRLCVSMLCRHIVECDDISAYYLRFPTKQDARNITNLHKRQHGIDGMMGSLDVTKVHWANCPTAWHGQFKGKEGIPTISLEAVVDYNLWIWHSAFGFPDSLNDLNIWEKSPLLNSMTDGTNNEIDFPFIIDGQQFAELFYLVDGIYPWLSRFLLTVKDPTTFVDKFYASFQEAARKAIERAFGVWKRKFLSVGNSVRLHYRDDIFFLVKATI
ncbi:hypothetical protein ACHAWO_008114, partial [Cyclotella atomus]